MITFDDVRLIKHQITGAKHFGYWVHFRDQRPNSEALGIKGKKSMIKFVTECLGPMGGKWQYQRFNQVDYIIKMENEADLLFLVLRFR
jgi:hypothetical protein